MLNLNKILGRNRLVNTIVRDRVRTISVSFTVFFYRTILFALLIVRLKNSSVTVAIEVKNGTIKKTENDPVWYGHGDKFRRTFVLVSLSEACLKLIW